MKCALTFEQTALRNCVVNEIFSRLYLWLWLLTVSWSFQGVCTLYSGSCKMNTVRISHGNCNLFNLTTILNTVSLVGLFWWFFRPPLLAHKKLRSLSLCVKMTTGLYFVDFPNIFSRWYIELDRWLQKSMIPEYAFGAERLSRQKIHAKDCNKNIAILIRWTWKQWLFVSGTKDFEVKESAVLFDFWVKAHWNWTL